MAFNELIKSFGRIRRYIRGFYVYGFSHRGDLPAEKRRTYDDVKRRCESWLSDYMSFRSDEGERRVFLTVDSRSIPTNPLFRAFKAKSFTDRDIMLHFHLMDILTPTKGYSREELLDELTTRLFSFGDTDDLPDANTVLRKLKELIELGMVRAERSGRSLLYYRCGEETDITGCMSMLQFFTETAPMGVIGAYLQDKCEPEASPFRFKHGYLLNVLDSEVLYALVNAIRARREVLLVEEKRSVRAVPLRLYHSSQNAREHLLALNVRTGRFAFYRVDMIDDIREVKDPKPLPEDIEQRLAELEAHSWGVTTGSSDALKHLSMTVYAAEEEGFIVERLMREKRCGTVEQLDATHWRFSAEVYSTLELLPWVRTFIGRITELTCDEEFVLDRFRRDMRELETLYGGDEDAV